MAENKTRKNKVSVASFLNVIENPRKRYKVK